MLLPPQPPRGALVLLLLLWLVVWPSFERLLGAHARKAGGVHAPRMHARAQALLLGV